LAWPNYLFSFDLLILKLRHESFVPRRTSLQNFVLKLGTNVRQTTDRQGATRNDVYHGRAHNNKQHTDMRKNTLLVVIFSR